MTAATSQPMTSEPWPAVILAAGEGRRLRSSNGGVPKALTPLLGITLLERAILSCEKAGVGTCYVVTGCESEKIIAHIDELRTRIAITIHVIENPDWEHGDTTSLLAAAPHLNGPFLLLMGDLVFDPDILRRLTVASGASGMCFMAIDRRTDQVFDSEDSTKAQIEGSIVTSLGKTIPSFNAIVTGLFLCRAALLDALTKTRHSGKGSLDDGFSDLTATGKLVAVDVGNRFWIDVDTGEALSYAKDLLQEKQRS